MVKQKVGRVRGEGVKEDRERERGGGERERGEGARERERERERERAGKKHPNRKETFLTCW